MPLRDIRDLTKEELIEQYLKMRSMLDEKTKKLDEKSKKYDALNRDFFDLQTNYNDLQKQLKEEREKYLSVVSAKYQSQRNKIALDMPTLFDDVEDSVLKMEAEECEEVEIGPYKRRRVPKKKHIDYSDLRREIEVLPVPEGEDICPNCGSKMQIKKYIDHEELVIIKPDAYVRVTRIPVMECVECQALNEDGTSTYVEVSHPNPLFPRSKCSAELLAYILDMKYSAGLPLYAIEKDFAKQGLIIPRQNMCNWVISSLRYLDPLFQLMKEELLSYSYIHADETTTQCLNEEGKPATSTSYMFVYHSSRLSKHKMTLYDYASSRSGDNAARFLEGYKGWITTDAYQGYNKVSNVQRSMCNVHALRNFKDAYKLLPKGKGRSTSEEAQAIKMYDEIFHLDNEAEKRATQKYSDVEKQAEYILKIRQRDIKPKFDVFLSWLEKVAPHCSRYKMSKAIHYVLNNRAGLTAFLSDGHLSMENQIAERAIRPFVVIRNRCKFYVSTTGADVSAKIYSLAITCEENGINPYMYFMHLFKEMPDMDLKDKDALRKLLPYSEELPHYTKTLSRKEIQKILSEDNSKNKR